MTSFEYEMTASTLAERQAVALESIAASLAIIAGDITERKERERDSLVSQYRHLQSEARRADDRFGSADNAMARRHTSTITDSDRGWLRRCEEDAEAAHAALDAFIAANPGIAELAGDE